MSAERHFSFIGVTTASSAIMRGFPRWAEHLSLGNVSMAGHDLPLHATPESYRDLVSMIKLDPLEIGGLVTAHKIDLFEACRDQFDYADHYAELCGEVSSLSKRKGQFRAHAKDPISSGRSLDEFIEQDYWTGSDAEALLFGAGGSNLAITLHLLTARSPRDRTRRIVIVNRSKERLRSMRAIHGRLHAGVEVRYVHNSDPHENDKILADVAAGSLVVNGTGMGKDSPGSPITDGATFPDEAMVWELNYRGQLDFLHQAERQRSAHGLRVEDGWRYFVHGWTCVVEEVFEVEMTPQLVEELSAIALRARNGTGRSQA